MHSDRVIALLQFSFSLSRRILIKFSELLEFLDIYDMLHASFPLNFTGFNSYRSVKTEDEKDYTWSGTFNDC